MEWVIKSSFILDSFVSQQCFIGFQIFSLHTKGLTDAEFVCLTKNMTGLIRDARFDRLSFSKTLTMIVFFPFTSILDSRSHHFMRLCPCTVLCI